MAIVCEKPSCATVTITAPPAAVLVGTSSLFSIQNKELVAILIGESRRTFKIINQKPAQLIGASTIFSITNREESQLVGESTVFSITRVFRDGDMIAETHVFSIKNIPKDGFPIKWWILTAGVIAGGEALKLIPHASAKRIGTITQLLGIPTGLYAGVKTGEWAKEKWPF